MTTTPGPRTEAGKRLLDHPMDKTWTLGAILAIEAEASVLGWNEAVTSGPLREAEARADVDGLVARLEDGLAFALGALNDPEVLGEEAKRRIRALLAGDKAEAPRDSTGHRSVDGYCIEPGCTVHAAAPRAATEPDLTDALRERFATLEALAEAVAAYLDPENQYTESRLNTVRRLLGSLSAGDKAEAPE